MSLQTLPDCFVSYPTVYAVRNEYQITVSVTAETLMWVKVGDEEYYDDSNGILRSGRPTHIMKVPMEELDRAKGYTVCFRRIQERLPYFSKTGDVEEMKIPFRPIPQDHIHIYHIADTHNQVDIPVQTGKFFGDRLDLLILNGDIPDHSGDVKNFAAIHRIAGLLTKGEIPVIYSRGNHDLRGIHAEDLAEHTPTDNGNSYFTFRLGALWGIVMDCGEDKPDTHDAYGHTICCSVFRRRETKFLEKVIRNASSEYAAEGVKYRMVVSHVPFSDIPEPPFDIEIELYTKWCDLLRENVHPQVMLCGHTHKAYVSYNGSEHDKKGQPCTVVVGSRVKADQPESYGGAAIELSDDGIDVKLTDLQQNVFCHEVLPL